MKYAQQDFSHKLEELINNTEQAFNEYQELLITEYAPLFSKRNQKITLEFKKTGTNFFKPDYHSFISVRIYKNKLINIMIEVPIWKTKAYLLGIPLSKNVPGSKVKGELITLEVAKDTIREFIEDNLKKNDW